MNRQNFSKKSMAMTLQVMLSPLLVVSLSHMTCSVLRHRECRGFCGTANNAEAMRADEPRAGEVGVMQPGEEVEDEEPEDKEQSEGPEGEVL